MKNPIDSPNNCENSFHWKDKNGHVDDVIKRSHKWVLIMSLIEAKNVDKWMRNNEKNNRSKVKEAKIRIFVKHQRGLWRGKSQRGFETVLNLEQTKYRSWSYKYIIHRTCTRTSMKFIYISNSSFDHNTFSRFIETHYSSYGFREIG